MFSFVNWWSLVSTQHQQEFTIWRYSEEGNLIQCKQLNWDTTLDRSALLHSLPVFSALARRLPRVMWGGGMQWVFSQSAKGTCRVSGTDLDRQQSPSLVPDWFIFMQMRTASPHSEFDWTESHCFDWLKWSYSGQWKCCWGYTCAAAIGLGKPQTQWLK